MIIIINEGKTDLPPIFSQNIDSRTFHLVPFKQPFTPSIASFLGSSQQCLRSFFSFDWTFHWEEGDVILKHCYRSQ